MGKVTGFLEIEREQPARRKVEERVQDWFEIYQPFPEEKRVVGFFWTYRQVYPVSRDVLRDIATQFHNWVKNRSQKWGAPIIQDPETRRDKELDSYFKAAKDDQVVCILKARQPARILMAIGNKKDNRWHLEYKQRWVDQYNFYLQDAVKQGDDYVLKTVATIVENDQDKHVDKCTMK